ISRSIDFALMRPQQLARRLYQRSRAARAAKEQARFSTSVRLDAKAPELLLSPHWDDAVLDCWSVLSAGGGLTVVNVFAGSPAPGTITLWDSITGASDSAARTQERRAEDAAALSRAAREPVNLPFLDSQYRRVGAAPELAQMDAAIA